MTIEGIRPSSFTKSLCHLCCYMIQERNRDVSSVKVFWAVSLDIATMQLSTGGLWSANSNV